MIEAYGNLMAPGAGELSLNTLGGDSDNYVCSQGECSEVPKRNDGMLLDVLN